MTLQNGNQTARFCSEVVEILKRSEKTSLIKAYSCYRLPNGKDTARVKNSELTPDPYNPLTKENAHKVSTIINIIHPEWGIKRFIDKTGETPYFSHTNGQAVIFDDSLKFWRVFTFKED